MKIQRIDEVCLNCGLDEEIIIRFVQEEWVRPAQAEQLGFDEADLARIHFIKELREDFGVNDEAVPIILHLVDQLNGIYIRVKED